MGNATDFPSGAPATFMKDITFRPTVLCHQKTSNSYGKLITDTQKKWKMHFMKLIMNRIF